MARSLWLAKSLATCAASSRSSIAARCRSRRRRRDRRAQRGRPSARRRRRSSFRRSKPHGVARVDLHDALQDPYDALGVLEPLLVERDRALPERERVFASERRGEHPRVERRDLVGSLRARARATRPDPRARGPSEAPRRRGRWCASASSSSPRAVRRSMSRSNQPRRRSREAASGGRLEEADEDLGAHFGVVDALQRPLEHRDRRGARLLARRGGARSARARWHRSGVDFEHGGDGAERIREAHPAIEEHGRDLEIDRHSAPPPRCDLAARRAPPSAPSTSPRRERDASD